MPKRLCGVLVVFLLLAGGEAAGSDAPFIGTRGYISPVTDSLLGLEMNLTFGGEVISFVPELVGQFDLGGFALGADMGFALAIPDEGETSFGLGNFAIFGKGKTCRGVGLKLCIGGQLELAFAPWEADNDSVGGLMMGMLTHGRFGARFGSELMTVTPSIAMSAEVQWLYFQVHLGPEVLIPFSGEDRETEIALVWGFAVGVSPADLFTVALGIRGMSTLTFDDNDTWNYLDLIFQFPMRSFTPVVAFGFPLDNGVQQFIDAIITVGALARF